MEWTMNKERRVFFYFQLCNKNDGKNWNITTKTIQNRISFEAISMGFLFSPLFFHLVILVENSIHSSNWICQNTNKNDVQNNCGNVYLIRCQLFSKYSQTHSILHHFHYSNMGVVDFLHYFLLYFPHRFLFYFKHCHLLNASCCFFFSLFFFLFRFTLNLSQEKNSALRCLEFFNINSHTNTKLINHNLWTHSL